MAEAIRVLVCDEDPDSRVALRRSLQRAALGIAGETGLGTEAISFAADHRPDVILIAVEEPVTRALEICQGTCEETVFIGDSRHDMECGRAAGVKIAAVLWGPFDRAHLEDLRPDYWLAEPRDIRELL